ncbi:TPR domain protein, putative component of TonB system [uncultured Candidatus Thioglobus sp.]|nr:TPR domain protein, putative component of TonB system [uncultured Candidatus Thioglobus sp.]
MTNKQKEPSKPKTVNSVVKFLKHLKTIEGSAFLYRGHANCAWKLESSAYRRLKKPLEPKDIDPAILQGYITKLLEKTRRLGHGEKDGKKLSDLELLAELQHNGAATCLLDFTENALVALWFACHSNDKKDGQVIVMPTADIAKFSIVNTEALNGKIENFWKKNKLWKWTPQYRLNRIVAQHSVFVFGKDSIDEQDSDYKTINISENSKNNILKELSEQFGINEAYLFSDFDGFASSNAHDKEYTDYDATDYCNFDVKAYQMDEYEQAMDDFDQAIKLNPNADAYYIRGTAKGELNRHEEAIDDFDQAIDINPNMLMHITIAGLQRVN